MNKKHSILFYSMIVNWILVFFYKVDMRNIELIIIG